jgi:circadian clock protein KaiC
MTQKTTSTTENTTADHPGLSDLQIKKCPTGISGLDSITGGGLPEGRPTLICGTAGSGKTMLATEFLVRGVLEFGEPGVLVAFEERASDLTANMASIGWDLTALQKEGKLAIESFGTRDTGLDENPLDLSHLFARLELAIDEVGAKRVVLDSLEVPLAGLKDQATIRSELHRLSSWIKEKGVTAVITGERGTEALTKNGIEEYVSDCVILLDNRVIEEISTRRLRIVKYRGSRHELNEFPFLISDDGVKALPMSNLGLNYQVNTERFLTGIDELDSMLGDGIYQGNNILINGTAGTGKTTIGATMSEASCKRGERVLMLLFEESPDQLIRNMKSIGVDLGKWREKGVLRMDANRPSSRTPEHHLMSCLKAVLEFKPDLVVVDPISSMIESGTHGQSWAFMMRLVDLLKTHMVTSVFLDLSDEDSETKTQAGVSSLMDTWIRLRAVERYGGRDPVLSLIKSRGTAHSRQDREFYFTPEGLKFIPPYIGPGGVVTGSARAAQEVLDKAERVKRTHELEGSRLALKMAKTQHEAQMNALKAEFEAKKIKLEREIRDMEEAEQVRDDDRLRMASMRGNPE